MITATAKSYNITDIVDHSRKYAHILLSDFGVYSSQTNNVTVTNAELGDTVTHTVTCHGLSSSINSTQGSDKSANITTAANSDKMFRTAYLGYDR